MVESELIDGISSVGFPIVAFFLMYRMATNSIEKNTSALTSIQMTLEKVCEKISH